MKGQQCSWRDMRKIKHILESMDKLQGEYDALMRCSAKSTRSEWRDIIEIMDEVRISEPKKLQPWHLKQIHHLADRDDWQHWVNRCEKNKLSVANLRQELRLAKVGHREQWKKGQPRV